MVETGVEMKAGQTLAIAGLVQNTVESQNSGLPWISEVPYLGVPFRSVKEQINEVETLILVTPELVEPLDANQVPPCGPGMESASPSDWELFFKGHLEVPVCCRARGLRAVAAAAGPTAGAPGVLRRRRTARRHRRRRGPTTVTPPPIRTIPTAASPPPGAIRNRLSSGLSATTLFPRTRPEICYLFRGASAAPSRLSYSNMATRPRPTP